MRLRLALLFLCCSILLGWVPTARAQSEVRVTHPEVDYQFGEAITFSAQVESEQEIESVELIVETPGTPTFIGSASISPTGRVDFIYDLQQRPLRAFATVTYSYRFDLKGGEEVKSDSFSFPYLDNRFDWQRLESGKFIVYWNEGELTFARDIIDAAEAGREKVLELLQRPKNNQKINIYVYGDPADLQTTLTATGSSWVGGHADPELGSVVVALPPGADRSLEVQRQIPHEITHIMLYRFMGDGYQYLPRWVNEGIASQMELFPNPAYEDVLERAHREKDLIPVAHMCHSFPADQALVILAYAESDSILSYIVQEYGVDAVRALISAYDQGVSCNRGVEMALGMGISALERDWKRVVFGGGMIGHAGGREVLVPVLLGLLILLLAAIVLFIWIVQRRRVRGGKDDGTST